MQWWLYLLPAVFALSPAFLLTLSAHLWGTKVKCNLRRFFIHLWVLFAGLLNGIFFLDMFLHCNRPLDGYVFGAIFFVLYLLYGLVIVKKLPVEVK